MTVSDWIASLALLVAGAALGLEFRRWFEGKPRLFLSVMADAVQYPDDDRRPKLALTVTNRGSMATTITHMIAFTYESRWKRWRNRPAMTGIVNCPNFPSVLGVNAYWIGMMHYNNATSSARSRGQLYVGVIAAHSRRNFLIPVPPKRDRQIPTRDAEAAGE